MAIVGQEDVARAAADLLAAYEKGDSPIYFNRLQTLMSNLIPYFPHIATAVAVQPHVKAIVDEWRESGSAPQEALMLLWEDYHDSYVGRA